MTIIRIAPGSHALARVCEQCIIYILADQHVRQLVFTHRLGQRQASVVYLGSARVVEVVFQYLSPHPGQQC
jgi:hypothetical protein